MALERFELSIPKALVPKTSVYTVPPQSRLFLVTPCICLLVTVWAQIPIPPLGRYLLFRSGSAISLLEIHPHLRPVRTILVMGCRLARKARRVF